MNGSEKLIQPLPWHARQDGDLSAIVDAQGVAVLGHVTHDEADFIARACNSHAELLAALGRAVDTIRAFHDIGVYARSKRDDDEAWRLYQKSPEMQAINAAIAKAEGRS